MLIMRMAKHTFPPRQLKAFTTNTAQTTRLTAVGYMHGTPTLAWLPASTPELDINITAALLAIKKGRTPSQAALAEGIARTTIGKLHNAAQPGCGMQQSSTVDIAGMLMNVEMWSKQQQQQTTFVCA